tara:strand:- start:244 stop:468 length:225 start_codon:yes stop_codon:yes gene_type:complete
MQYRFIGAAGMKKGDLVRITRASVGVPYGSLALIETKLKDTGGFTGIPDAMWRVYMLKAGRQRRYLGRDLEIVS